MGRSAQHRHASLGSPGGPWRPQWRARQHRWRWTPRWRRWWWRQTQCGWRCPAEYRRWWRWRSTQPGRRWWWFAPQPVERQPTDNASLGSHHSAWRRQSIAERNQPTEPECAESPQSGRQSARRHRSTDNRHRPPQSSSPHVAARSASHASRLGWWWQSSQPARSSDWRWW